MEEVWKAVRGFKGYAVSNQGRVSGKFGGIMRQYLDPSGYRWVKMEDAEGRHVVWVNELVAVAFVPIADGAGLVRHKNGDALDNRADNLEWVSFDVAQEEE